MILKSKKKESTPDSFGNYKGMELLMNCGGNTPELERVIKRLYDDDGNPIGTAHQNLIPDLCVYESEYYNQYTFPV